MPLRYVKLDHAAGEVQTSKNRFRGGENSQFNDMEQKGPFQQYDGGQANSDDNKKLYSAREDFNSPNYKKVPDLFSFMFDNSASDPHKEEATRLEEEKAIDEWCKSQGMHKDHHSFPRAVFVDALGSAFMPRACGRYVVEKKVFNGRPCYYSRMTRMYLFNNSDNPHKPEWAICRKLGGNAAVVFFEGDVLDGGSGKSCAAFAYDKYSDENHVRGLLFSLGEVEDSNPHLHGTRMSGSHRINLGEEEGKRLFPRTVALGKTSYNFDAYIQDENIRVMWARDEFDLKEEAKGKPDAEQKRMWAEHDDMLQKEW